MQMQKKLIVILLLVVCFQNIESSIVWGNSPKNITENAKITAQEALRKIDIQTRREYWAYLRNPSRICQLYKTFPDKFSYFIVYEGVIGVFLTVSDYYRQTGDINITALVRIGSSINDTPASNHIINLQPIIIGLKIQKRTYTVDIDSNGNIVFDQDMVAFRNSTDPYMNQRMRIVDIYVKRHFWIYLNGASLEESEVIRIGKLDCALFLYNQPHGIYLSIAGLNNYYQLDVRAFVRLGKQHNNNKNQSQPNSNSSLLADLQPTIIQLK